MTINTSTTVGQMKMMWAISNLIRNPNHEVGIEDIKKDSTIFLIHHWCKRLIYYNSIGDTFTAQIISNHIHTI